MQGTYTAPPLIMQMIMPLHELVSGHVRLPIKIVSSPDPALKEGAGDQRLQTTNHYMTSSDHRFINPRYLGLINLWSGNSVSNSTPQSFNFYSQP